MAHHMFRHLVLVLLLCPVGVSAQARQDGNGSKCHGIISSLMRRGADHKFVQCAPEAAPYIAREILATGNHPDIERFRLLSRLTFFIRDPAVFEAALQLAKRDKADPAVTVLGLLIALNNVSGPIVFHREERVFRKPIGEGCAPVVYPTVEKDFRWADAGLAPGAEARLRAVAESLSGAAHPLMVRRFASCALLLLPDPADDVVKDYSKRPDHW